VDNLDLEVAVAADVAALDVAAAAAVVVDGRNYYSEP
jgi:hypothetical protein